MHGENKHKVQNAKLAEMMGIERKNIVLAQNGDIIKMNSNLCRISGNIGPKTIYVDGVGFGNIEDIVLRDRKLLSRDGIITIVVGIDTQTGEVIYKPDFILKGITYMENFDFILKECKKLIINSLRACFESNITNSSECEKYVTERLEKFIFKKARIRPVIMTRVVSI